ncbi:MAG TPA: DUF2630 family protein [Acidimicrobiia bacterium]|nr:DUF2630 family protein [Acidimicrobiia bacterium]
MDDRDLVNRIDDLVRQEHELRTRHGEGVGLNERELDTLRALEVQLDQCWDLLRQRRARREFGTDPDAATARGPETVERYQQ